MMKYATTDSFYGSIPASLEIVAAKYVGTHLLAARWNEDLISDCWPDLLRMGGSLKYGQASASHPRAQPAAAKLRPP
jgi:hypothetical protein